MTAIRLVVPAVLMTALVSVAIMTRACTGQPPAPVERRPSNAPAPRSHDGQVTLVDVEHTGALRDRVATEVDAGAELEQAAEILAACLDSVDPQVLDECIRSFLNRFPQKGTSMLARATCDRIREGRTRSVTPALATAIDYWRHQIALTELAQIYRTCPDWRCSDLLQAAIRSAAARYPGVLDRLTGELSPALAFSDTQGIFPLIAARELWLLRPSNEIASLLHDGALGLSGGSVDQVDHAALLSASMLLDSRERVAFVRDVASSTSLPAGVDVAGMGSTMMHLLYEDSIRANLSEEELIDATITLLHSPDLGKGAALHVLKLFDEAPSPISKETWAEVVSHAKLITGG